MMKDRNRFIMINITIVVCLIIFIPTITSAFSGEDEQNIGTYLLGKAMAAEIPAVNSFEKDEDDVTNTDFSIKDYLISSVGIDFGNPLSILQKEIAFIDTENPDIETDNYSLNPFKLTQEDISKDDIDVKIDNPELKKPMDNSKPQVFIYHTHTTECYQVQIPADVSRIKNFNSTDFSIGVCAVGEDLTKELQEKYGISTIHDETIHTASQYTEAYTRSGVTIQKYLDKYKDFNLIIDIHRDSNTSRTKMTKTINGKKYATFEFVLDRSNPHFAKNQAVVTKLISISNKLFPGACRQPQIYYYNRGRKHFNQDKSNNAILIEVGSHVNTVEEATNTSELLSRVIAEYINGAKSTS
ncbi:MAG: stage II sporulation protein P [Bacillota bacterium]|nr:stage II sporulation protein P [Bacillota bacterium]